MSRNANGTTQFLRRRRIHYTEFPNSCDPDPLKTVPASPSLPHSRPDDGAPTEPLSILLIEDNPGDARLFAEYLDDSPVEATLRHEQTLQAGLQALGEIDPDVLVADLGLPDSEGIQTVQALGTAVPQLPIVVLTGQDNLQAALQTQEAGATEYLRKENLTPALMGRTLRWAVQRRRMQAKLRQRDAWIRSITENISAGVFRVGPTGHIEYANKALAEMLGFEHEETLIGQDLTTFPTDPAKGGTMLAQEGASDVEVEFETQHGSTFVGLLSAEAAYGPHGTPIHYDGIITDITERARRKQKLRMLSEAVEQAKEAVLITEGAPLDEPGPRVEYVNSAFETMTGYAEDEIRGKTPRVLQGPETDREVLDSLRAALQAGEECQGETVNYRKDETPYRVQWNVAPVRNEEDSIEHWVSVQRNVTEEREQAEELRLLAKALEQVGDKVVITDRDGRIEKVNEAFEEISGYSEEEALGKTPRILQSGEHDEDFYEELWDTIRAGETLRAEFTNERKDGTLYVEEEVISPVTDADGEITHFVSTGRDVTEKRKREEELRRQKHLLEQTQRLAGAWEVDLRTGEVSWSQKVYEIHELEPGTEIGVDDAIEFYAPEVRPTIREAFERCVEQGESYDLELPLITANGTHRWVRTVGAPSERENGSVVVVAGAFQDITERKEAEKNLRKERDLLNRILDTSPAAIVLLDPQGQFVQASGRAEEVLGLEKEAVTDRAYNDPEWGIEAPDGTPVPDEELPFARVMSTGEPVYDYEHAIIWPDGTRRLLSVSGAPLRAPDGELEGAVFHLDDITEQRRHEQTIERQNDLFAKAQEIAHVGAWEYNVPDGTATLTEQAYKIHGLSPKTEMSPKKSIGFYHPDDRPTIREAFTRAIEEGVSYDLELRLTDADGTERWVRTMGEPQVDDGEIIRVRGILQDITERKQREKDLRDAKEEAERMNRLKSAFLANMSHEIRTPLTSILGFAEAIGEEAGGAQNADEVDLPTLVQFSSLIERSGRRLMDTLTDVLNLSKLQAGEMMLELGPVDLAAEARETAEEFGPQAQTAGVELSVETGDTPARAHADAGGLQIALRNLLSNAIKYTDEGGEVRVRTRKTNDLAIVEVEDTGIGMDPEKAQGLFEAFKQESEGVGREYEGTGLGLTVTKEVLDQMGGSVEVETEKGEGSRFTVRLPAGTDGNGEQ